MTSYEVVYNRFLNRITDFNLGDIDDFTLKDMMNNWLESSIVRTRTSDATAFNRDKKAEVFENDLSDLNVELLAMGMTLAWLDQYLNSTENVLQFIGGKEEKYYSQANHIAELRALRADTVREMERLYTYNSYTNNSYFD